MDAMKLNLSVRTQGLFKRLRYRHLYMLVTLGNSQNLHRAAAALNMSQPTLTRMLQEVESVFGCNLFERQPRGMVPTPVGEELLKFADSALNSLDRCAEDLSAREEGGYGHLAIGVVMGGALERVVSTIATIKQSFPHLGIRMMSDTSDVLLEMLEQEKLDVAVARLSAPVERSRFDFTPLGNDRLVVAVRSGHPLTQQPAIALSAIVSQWPWVLQPMASPGRKAFERWLADQDLSPPTNAIECSSIWAMLQLVQLSESVMVLSESVIHDYVRTGLITVLNDIVIDALAPYGVILRKEGARSRELQRFLSHLQAGE